MIPFVDLKKQHASLETELNAAMAEIYETSSYINGPAITDFEQSFSTMTGTTFAKGVGSGTEALHLAVRALDIRPGDEVISVSNTWISTVFAASYVGAKVVLIDIDPATYQMDVAALEAAITPKTKAVIPVHMYGHPAPMKQILELCRPRGIKIIEDVAHAPMAEIDGQKVGSFGDLGCFSFYPSKNLGCYGDGGAIVTSDPILIEKINLLANYGQSKPHNHQVVGYNSRLDTLQAAVLNTKLPHLEEWNTARRANAKKYNDQLKNLPVKCPSVADGVLSVFHLYVIEIENRDACLQYLREHGVMAQIHYPKPIHLQKCYTDLGYKKGDLKQTEVAAKRILSLPMYAELTDSQINEIAGQIRSFIEQD